MSNKQWGFVDRVRQLLINWPFRRGYFGSWDAFLWLLPLCRGGHSREVKIRVTVRQYEKRGRCREVAISVEVADSGGSTVVSIFSRRRREKTPCLQEASKEQF